MRILLVVVAMGWITLVAQAQETAQPGKPKGKDQVKVDKIPKVTQEKPMSFWMEQKLDFSKSILESLTKGDFETLASDAEQMRLLGKIEGFVRRKNADYRTQLRTFDIANQELVRQAQRKNSEGATLAFNQLTTSCVACHLLIREELD